MPTYVAFLRAINLGRNRKLPMADLRTWLEQAGLEDVETYINTGNVRFTTSMRSRPKIEKYLEDVLAAGCGFDVPAILFSPAELKQVHDDAMQIPTPPFGNRDGQRRYVTFFKESDAPDADAAVQIAAWSDKAESDKAESARAIGRAVHVWLARPSQDAKFFSAFKKVLALGTNRDLKVVRTLAERWGS